MIGNGGRKAITVIATPSVSSAVSITARRDMCRDSTA
jgi:hypothetical protein